MRLITLEEHYRAPALKSVGGALPDPPPDSPLAKIQAKLDDLGDQRLADMDAGGIDIQVISHGAPGTEQIEPADAIELAREANDYLAASIAPHPDRFAAFATLPTAAPAEAADELERDRLRARIQGRPDQRPRPRPFPGRPLLLADLRTGGAPERPDLPAPDAAAARGPRRLLRRPGAAGRAGAVDGGLGVARRDRPARAAADRRRGVRRVPRAPDDRRPHGRGAAVLPRALVAGAAPAGRPHAPARGLRGTRTSTSRPAGCSPTRP